MGIQDTFKAVSDSTRREILNILKDGSKTVGEISEHFSMTGATISHHLSVLKEAGLITDNKQGKYIFYELNMTVVDEIFRWAASFKGGNENEKRN